MTDNKHTDLSTLRNQSIAKLRRYLVLYPIDHSNNGADKIIHESTL